MEYFLVFVLEIIGIGFSVLQKAVTLGDKFPEKTIREVFIALWKSSWGTIMTSGLVLVLNLVAQYIYFGYLGLTLPDQWYWDIAPFATALVFGYLGQRIIYKFFGKAEEFLNKQTDRIQ